MSSQLQSPITPNGNVLAVQHARDYATEALVNYYRSATGKSDKNCATMAQRTMQKFDEMIDANLAQKQQQVVKSAS